MHEHPFSLENSSRVENLRQMLEDAPNVLEMNRIIRCSKSSLFSYFTYADKLKTWMANSVEGELAPGFRTRLCWSESTYVDIIIERMIPCQQIVFTMIDSHALDTRVTLDFHRHDQFCFLHLTHQVPEEVLEQSRILNLRKKWTFFLDNLASVSESHFDLRPLKSEEEGWSWLRP